MLGALRRRVAAGPLPLSRGFADRGAKRKCYADPGFQELGYATVEDYSYTDNRDWKRVPGHKRGTWLTCLAPAKSVELDSYYTSRKWWKKQKREPGDARRAYEQQKQQQQQLQNEHQQVRIYELNSSDQGSK